MAPLLNTTGFMDTGSSRSLILDELKDSNRTSGSSSLTNSNNSTRTSISSSKSVHFDSSLEVIEFPIVLSNNVVELGPAVGLAPHHVRRQSIDFDGYEESRTWTPQQTNNKKHISRRCVRPRRPKKEMILSLEERADILIQAGFTPSEIISAGKASNATYRNRIKSIQDQNWDKFHEFLEGTQKILFFGAKSA